MLDGGSRDTVPWLKRFVLVEKAQRFLAVTQREEASDALDHRVLAFHAVIHHRLAARRIHGEERRKTRVLGELQIREKPVIAPAHELHVPAPRYRAVPVTHLDAPLSLVLDR